MVVRRSASVLFRVQSLDAGARDGTLGFKLRLDSRSVFSHAASEHRKSPRVDEDSFMSRRSDRNNAGKSKTSRRGDRSKKSQHVPEPQGDTVDGGNTGPIYKDANPSGKRYQFYWAHHGRGTKDDSQWLSVITHREEFLIFAESDQHEIADGNGNLFGTRRQGATVLELGTRGERIAKFWCANEGSPWHRFPLYPLKRDVPENRKEYECRPPKNVFVKMQEAGLIDETTRVRLFRGDYR